MGEALGSIPSTWQWGRWGGGEGDGVKENFVFRVIASLVAEVWPRGFPNKSTRPKYIEASAGFHPGHQ